MNTLFPFEFTQGTVIGRDHRLAGRNNQDASHVICSSDRSLVVAVVADGCGSGTRPGFASQNEVGAQLGVRVFAQSVMRHLQGKTCEQKRLEDAAFWNPVRDDVSAFLRCLAHDLSDQISPLTNQYLLFTLVAAVLTPQHAVFLSFGDGHLFINGTHVPIGPFPRNMPPYIGYCLVDSSLEASELCFHVHQAMPLDDLETFLIGTDGLTDMMRVEEKEIPGQSKLVGPISQFWEDDHLFKNSDIVRRRLSLINRDYLRFDRKTFRPVRANGHLSDDTTLVAGRRCTQPPTEAPCATST